MPAKKIPGALREYLEKQIVRGSMGYEPMERILRENTEEDLLWFLEFYEKNIRDGLENCDKPSCKESLFSGKIKLKKDEEGNKDNRLASLFKNFSSEEDL